MLVRNRHCQAPVGSVGPVLVTISMPVLPAAIPRSAMTVGLSRSASTMGELPAVIWRARLVAASVSSKRLGILARQSSIVMRAMRRAGCELRLQQIGDEGRMPHLLPRRSQAGGADDHGQ